MKLIEHRTYGKGKILKERYGGFELYVEFEDGIKRWVRRDEIRFLSETPILVKHKTTRQVLSEEQFKARQIIEALRLGIVPHKYVEEFTFGREGEINKVKKWLHDSNNSSLIIVGEYGVGKTHLLEYIYSVALKDNWAVSMVELDPNEASFHKPRIIYQKIISSFRFRQRNGDFREFLRQIANSPRFYEVESHKYLGRVIEEIRNNTDDEDIWEWIEGKPSRYRCPPMYEFSTCANIYCYILSGIGWIAKNLLGLKGFLILFDEAENVDSYWYTSYQNNKVWNFLKGLIFMADNNELLLTEKVEPQYSWSGYFQGYWGKDTGLQYCGRLQLPFIWKIPCNVKIIFAFAPTWVLSKEPLNNIIDLRLDNLDRKVLPKISRSINNLYKTAYNFEYNNDLSYIQSRIPMDKTRKFIKGVIEALDLMRFHPNKPVEELLK